MRIEPSSRTNDNARELLDTPAIRSLRSLCSLDQQLASYTSDRLTMNNENIVTKESESSSTKSTKDSKAKNIDVDINININKADVDEKTDLAPDVDTGKDPKSDIDAETDIAPTDNTDEKNTDNTDTENIHIDKHITIDVDNDGDIDVDIDVNIDINTIDEEAAGKKIVMAMMVAQYRVEAILGGDPTDESNPMYTPEW